MPPAALPRHLQFLLVVFFAANLIHFVHNAEYIVYYPGMPPALTRERIYLAWVAGASVGLIGLLAYRAQRRLLGLALVAAYGALGIDGLAHYALALCSEHTLATNLTIGFEVLTGLCLLLASVRVIGSTVSMRWRLAR